MVNEEKEETKIDPEKEKKKLEIAQVIQ